MILKFGAHYSVAMPGRVFSSLVIMIVCASSTIVGQERKPPGRLIDLGGHRLHINCTGKGKPVVVVENGLGDFSFDWLLVQAKVSRTTRICTYDRAGYAWSDPGPKPRTFAQLNLELRDALAKLGEDRPFILVGHSFGGPVVRNFAQTYPHLVAGLVLVDSAFEGQYVGIGRKQLIRLGEDARGLEIPAPREELKDSDRFASSVPESSQNQALDKMYAVLPPQQQQWQIWAQSRPQLEDAEDSQRQWSGEYFKKWLATSQAGTLGSIPLIVLTRAEGGYRDGDYEISAQQLESARKEGQSRLAKLSDNSRQIMVSSGHNMELESPDEVVSAILRVVNAVRHKQKI